MPNSWAFRRRSERRTAIARARLIIDLGAVAANWRALDAMSLPSVETAAVVKADAYGLGAASVAPALAAAGARTFFVALAEEGAALREALGAEPTILVLSGMMPGDAPLMRAHRLVPCLNSTEQVAAFARDLPDAVYALQLDSGMNRLGLEAEDLASVARALPPPGPCLILSHLACADAPAHAENPRQRAAFAEFAAHLPPTRLSLAATGGVLLGAAYHLDMARPGIGLYGGLPFAEARPVATLSLPVIQVRNVAPDETVGYGAAWRATRPSRIATLAAGYADGLMRGIGAGEIAAYAGDMPCPLVGQVSMDLITVDVTGLAQVPEELDILNRHQGIDALAAAAGTIGYEVLTRLGGRCDRVYKEAAQRPDRE